MLEVIAILVEVDSFPHFHEGQISPFSWKSATLARMPKHEAMDIETVADLLNVSTRQIRTYVSQCEMPYRKEGRTPMFDWHLVLDWYVGYKSALEAGDRPLPGDEDEGEELAPDGGKNEDIRQATLRKTRAEANLKELALSRQRREVITIADAKVRLDRMMGNLRTKLLGIAPKLASRLEGVKARPERESAIREEMENLCREISTGEIIDLPESTDDKTSTLELESVSAAADDFGAAELAGVLRGFYGED